MESFLAAQGDILEAIALGSDFADIADRLCRQTEALFAGTACSVTSVDREGLLHVLTAPSFPEIYRQAIDGRLIGPTAGVCGAGAFRGGEIVVTDIAADPVFDDLREPFRDLPFRASWSCPITVEDGRVVAIFAVYFEEPRAPTGAERAIMRTSVDLCRIAFQQNEARRHIHRLAYTDVLTNLPNRFSFELFVSEALGQTPARTMSIHCVDLHDFKTINDTLGHWGGDLLLAEVARRLTRACGATTYVARMAGDEFAICTADTGAATSDSIAEAILSALDAPFEVAGQSLKVEANIGIVIAPEHGRDVEQLLQRADMALHEAKRAGRHTSRIFTEGMAEEMRRLTLLKADLGEALAKGQFHLEYQPIIDFSRCSVSAFEALLRWTHPVKGRIPPDLFIPIAEDMGLIQSIGLFVLDRAIEDAASWPADIAVAVNVSPLQLKSDRFATRMREALDRHGLPPERLIVEVTETALFDQGAATRQTLDEIVAFGASIALDDFGTGYSSLNNLRDRRFSKIKIDKSFVLGIGSDAVCGAIVEGTIHFALKLGKRTTAEGIETPAQLAWLIRQGCDTGQGYLFSRPMPAERITPYLRTAPFSIAAASAEGLRSWAPDCPLAALAYTG